MSHWNGFRTGKADLACPNACVSYCQLVSNDRTNTCCFMPCHDFKTGKYLRLVHEVKHNVWQIRNFDDVRHKPHLARGYICRLVQNKVTFEVVTGPKTKVKLIRYQFWLSLLLL